MIILGDAPQLPPLRPPSRIRFLAIAILFPLVLLMVAGWLADDQYRAEQATAAAQDSYARRLSLTELISTLKDAETGQRGYVITGDLSFLTPYRGAEEEIAIRRRDLGRAFADTPAAHRRLAALNEVIDAKFVEMGRVLRLRNALGRAPAERQIAAGQGKRLMDRARAITDGMIAAEDSMRDRRTAVAHDRNMRIQRLIWTLIGVLAAALCAGLFLVWRTAQIRYRLERDAREAGARVRAIFDSTIDAIVILNPSGTIESMNVAAVTMLGFSAEELARSDVSVIIDIASGDGSFHDRIGLHDGVLREPWRVDRVAHRKDGSAVPVDVALGLMALPDGLHIVAAVRDASERKAVEHLKDEFISTVSHELRTPLTSVVGSLGLLRGGALGELPEGARRLVEIAENNSRRLIRLINDMLDIEKIGSGRMRFDMQSTDMAALVGQAAAASEGLAAASNVRLAIAAPIEPMNVVGDAERLLQVATNLLSNAIRFSPAGGTVHIGLEHRDTDAIVTIDDEGPGVPAAFRERIFARFAQAGGSGDPGGGSGLGLAISREIVRAHDGRIWFETAPTGGARFAFALRALPDNSDAVEDRRDRLLLCEDDPLAAATLREMLREGGFEIDLVSTLAEMLAATKVRRYAALLLDFNLPDGCGMDVIPALRDDPLTASLPIIIVSGGTPIDPDSGTAIEILDWLKKPVAFDKLTRAVQVAIDQSTAARPTLLHIDDDRDLLEVVAAALDGQGRLLKATSLASARAVLAQETPDIVILDLGLPDGSGADLLPALVDKNGIATPTIIYSAQDVPLEIERRVQAVLIKSRRSLPHLVRTIRGILDRGAIREDAA